jgi:hypothetical protein
MGEQIISTNILEACPKITPKNYKSSVKKYF